MKNERRASKSISINSNQARRIVMKWTVISLVVIASTFVVGAVPELRAERNKDCSNASLQGGYGFLNGQTVVPAGTPFAALGRWNFDGKGKFTNALTINDNGTVAHIKDSGTYTVDTDCTGKIFSYSEAGERSRSCSWTAVTSS